MTTVPQRRAWRWGVLATLLAAAVAAALPEAPDNSVVPALELEQSGPTGRAAASPTAPPHAAWPTPGSRASWRDAAATGADAAAWEPPPAPAQAAPPPQTAKAMVGPVQPPAPAFGYALIGRLDEDGVAKAVLDNGQRTLTVRAGDTVDGQWRVDAVDAAQVTLAWLPTQHRQIVAFSALPTR